MSGNINVEILRFNGEDSPNPFWQSYTIPVEEKNTVLGALLYIREHEDSTLAFRYGCRYKNCGLCAVRVDGFPKMACRTYVKDGMRIEPLEKLQVVRDLVVEREHLLAACGNNGIYIEPGSDSNIPIKESAAGAMLRRCIDCLACFSTCDQYRAEDSEFMGPYYFVKLAQLHLDPRNNIDRIVQAKKMGIEKCRQCSKKCYCINGIEIYQQAVQSLLQG